MPSQHAFLFILERCLRRPLITLPPPPGPSGTLRHCSVYPIPGTSSGSCPSPTPGQARSLASSSCRSSLRIASRGGAEAASGWWTRHSVGSSSCSTARRWARGSRPHYPPLPPAGSRSSSTRSSRLSNTTSGPELDAEWIPREGSLLQLAPQRFS